MGEKSRSCFPSHQSFRPIIRLIFGDLSKGLSINAAAVIFKTDHNIGYSAENRVLKARIVKQQCNCSKRYFQSKRSSPQLNFKNKTSKMN